MLPGFKATMERYLAQVQALGYKFIGLLAEAFGLPSDALSRFYDSDDLMQHRSKVGTMWSVCVACLISFSGDKDCQIPCTCRQCGLRSRRGATLRRRFLDICT
jgi:hypothetical protein